ncbi:MAG: ATP-binding protein [Dehalococcoidia bacterium]
MRPASVLLIDPDQGRRARLADVLDRVGETVCPSSRCPEPGSSADSIVAAAVAWEDVAAFRAASARPPAVVWLSDPGIPGEIVVDPDAPPPILAALLALALRAARAERMGADSSIVASVAQNERLYALGHLAEGAAHDLNNTLTLILGQAEIAWDSLRHGGAIDSDLPLAIDAIRQAAGAASSAARRLQDFARGQTVGPRTLVDCAALLHEAAVLTRPRWYDDAHRRGVQIDLEVRAEPVPPIAADPAELRDALINLIFNAVDAVTTSGRIVLSAACAGEIVVVEVADDGVGMSDEVQRRAFEPYFTTKGERGSGIGLPMVASVVDRHGGTIALASRPGQGTTITICLPLGSAPPPPPASPRPDAPAGRVLVIDDEPEIAEMIERMLALDDHRVAAFAGSQPALAALAEGGFDLVITDLGMPGVSGWAVAEAVKRIYPKLPVIVMSGWGADIEREAPTRPAVDAILPKPFKLQQLRDLVARLLAGQSR